MSATPGALRVILPIPLLPTHRTSNRPRWRSFRLDSHKQVRNHDPTTELGPILGGLYIYFWGTRTHDLLQKKAVLLTWRSPPMGQSRQVFQVNSPMAKPHPASLLTRRFGVFLSVALSGGCITSLSLFSCGR